MKSVKNIVIYVAIVVVFVVFVVSFEGSSINERTIVLGVGIDFVDGQFVVVCEVLSPSSSQESSQSKSISKVVTGKGESIALAFQNIFAMTGKEVSLGQCTVVVLGESLFEININDIIQFFGSSDSFKESAAVCVCKGSATDFFSTKLALGTSVATVLTELFDKSSSQVMVPSCNVLSLLRSQSELSGSGFVSYVSTQSQQEDNTVLFENIAVFRHGNFVTLLSSEMSQAFAVMESGVKRFALSVSGEDSLPSVVTVMLEKKSFNIEVTDKVNIKFVMSFSATEVGTDGATNSTNGVFDAKSNKKLPQEVLDKVVLKVKEMCSSYLAMQKQKNFDIVGTFKAIHTKLGSSFKEESKNFDVSTFNYSLEISVE